MSTRIENFSGPHYFLSNFYPCIIVLDDKTYNTIEHAFQAAKTDKESERQLIRQCKKPGEAKRLGRRITLRLGWNDLRIRVMKELLRQKFSFLDLRRSLLATGDAELVHTVYHNDTFWAVRNGVGENHLGRLLMEIRNELKSEATY